MNKLSIFSFAILAGLMFAGCGEKKEATAEPTNHVSRIKDPEYIKQIEARKEKRQQLFKSLSIAQKEYNALKAKDPECKEEATIAAKEKAAAAAKAIVEERKAVRKMIAERIHKDFKNNNKAQSKENK